MDAAGIITGVVIAVITGTLIPFATTEFSLSSKRRRAIIEARRAAFDAYIETTRRVEMDLLIQYPTAGASYETAVGNSPDRQAATARFEAQFSLRDKPLYELWTSGRRPAGYKLVLASWANGENRRARRAARRLLKGMSTAV